MFILRRGIVLSKYAVTETDLPLRHFERYRHPIKLFATETDKTNIMVDPKRVVSYDDMCKVINEPKKVIIDVRNPDEVSTTGMIPSSINIPLSNVKEALNMMSHDEFQRVYKRNKPAANDELIFYCRSGKRSTEALDQALKLGYNKKNGRALGPDGIPVEVWEMLRQNRWEWLTLFFNELLLEGAIPLKWHNSLLVSIFENKGDFQLQNIFGQLDGMVKQAKMKTEIISGGGARIK